MKERKPCFFSPGCGFKDIKNRCRCGESDRNLRSGCSRDTGRDEMKRKKEGGKKQGEEGAHASESIRWRQ